MKSTKTILACSAGAFAMVASLPAMAQTAGDDVVIATGIRSSLEQSLDVKRNSDSIVDAISAEDVGKFPDTNIAESLQRITGVAIDRSGGEGQFITVRGLGPEFNVVTINDRTIATDNDGREFSFDVLSSDIIQRAEVFKTPDASRQSGGIGALVNIVTNRPLERPGTNFAASLSGTYDTLRDQISPEGSLVGSWTNEDNTIGVAGGLSYSDRRSQRDRVLTGGFSERSGAPFINTGGAGTAGATGLTDADNVESLPAGTRVQQQAIVSRDTQERERLTANGTVQFAPTDAVTLTVDGLYTEFNVSSFDRQFSGFFSPPFIDPVVDANGTVTSFSRPGLDFLGRNPGLTTGPSQNDNVLTSANREAETYLIGANLDWELNDRLTANFDVSTSKAERDGINPFVVLGALAPTSPLIQLPDGDDLTTITNLTNTLNPSIQRLHFVNVNRTVIDDEVFEAKGKLDWESKTGEEIITVGASYSDRTKSRDLFDNFSPTQGGGVFCAYCGYATDFDDSILRQVNLDGFLSGVSGRDGIPLNFLTATFEDAFGQLNSDAAISDPNRSGRGALSDAELRARRDATDSFLGFYDPEFNPAGSFAVDEEVTSVFFNTAWLDKQLGAIPFSANFGLRVTHTETSSSGVDQPVTQFRESDGDTQLIPIFADPTNITIENSYTNVLPSANIKFDVTEDKIVRFAASKTVTRPTLTALGVANQFGGRANAPTSTGGNPNLEAFESTNFDAAFEWYMDDLSFFGVTGFYKSFDNFLESQTLPVPGQVVFPAGNASNPGGTDVTRDVTFLDTRTRNGETGSIVGIEAALQKAFENGFGAAINYTYVDSSIDRAEGSGNSDLDYNGLSPHSFNISGFYEKGPIQARVTYNYRDEFLVAAFSDQGEPREREAYGQLDASAAYDINDTFQIFAEGINILDEDTRDFSRFENRLLTYEDTGSRFTIGARAAF
ncbi:TonB-dependent receptor [Litorimonas sp. WD9-15]|uniref:TonB-dependent receptor n=1 Tax=Litorimonas sp. WD9-15 TaxID=3418716 RepID=UPI003D02FC6E